MKKITKILSIGLLTILVSSQTFAMENVSIKNISTANKKVVIKKKRIGIYAKQKKDELKEIKDAKNKYIKEKYSQAKNNYKNYKIQYKGVLKTEFKKIDKSTRQDILKARKDYKNELKSIREKIKTQKNFEKKLEYAKKIEELRAKKLELLRNKFKNNPKALEVIKKRREVYERNKLLRKQIFEKRREFRQKRAELINKYKILVVKKIGDKLDKLSQEKLINLSKKVDLIYRKYENNKKLNQAQKEKVLAILLSLQETIKDKIKILDAKSDNLIDEVLNEVE